MTTARRFRPVLLILMIGLLWAAVPGHARAADPVAAAVGDMGCAPWDPDYNNGDGTATRCRQRYVSDLLVSPLPSALLDLGDNQYDEGQLDEFQEVYDPTFGRANAVVYPSLGNAEYDTPNAQGFFDYFSSVGVTSRITGGSSNTSNFASGYYSFDIGSWHLIALNSNCAQVGGCAAGSPQELWLKSDLAANPNRCTLAYWHHPRWNSGDLGNDSSTAGFWTDLYNAHADVVLNGHGNHHYERFAPQTAGGVVDTTNGVREFIVSTGGESHGTPPTTPGDPKTSQITDYTSFGIMRLTLHPTSYDWQFVPAVGGSFTDSGSSPCHSTPAAQKPGSPSLTATAGDASVHLSWSAPSDGGSAITGYKVYRGTAAGGETLLKSVGNVTSTDDTTAVNGTKYYYRVSAVNAVGEGSLSNEVSATPAQAPQPAPFPATNVLDDFARGAGALGANWQSPGLADPGTVAIQSSGLTAATTAPASATWKAQTFAADQEAYMTFPVLPRSGQFFQIAGRVSNLSSSTVSCYFLRVTPSTGAWDLRKKVNGAGSTSIRTFNAPFAAGDAAGLRTAGSTISAYRKPAGGSWTAVGSVADTAIAAGGYLSFTLGDTTIRGGALGGGAIPSTPVAQRPAAPSLSAGAGDAVVHLSWSVPADGGSPITSYNVYRGTSSGGETLLKSVGNVTATDDATAVNGTAYWYRVAAVNGVGEGSQSNEVSATPVAAATIPGAPSLTATAGDATVHLGWSAPSDGGSPISAYKVYRGTSAGGETLLKTLGNVTSTDDATVVNGTTYWYRVSAVNGVGEGAASNEVFATPVGVTPPPPPVFPRTAVLDDFARAAGSLGLNWQSPGLVDPGTASIKASGQTGSSSGASSATWRTSFAADQEAYLTVPVLPKAGQLFQVAGRVSTLGTSGVSCYFLRVTPSTGVWDLRKKVNGATSTSIKTFSTPFAAGDAAGLQLVGSTITAYRKPALGIWAPVGSVTDTAIPGAGYLSFTLGDTTIRGGAFGGGSIN